MMKSTLSVLATLFAFYSCFAQESETRSLPSFSEISAHEGINVYIKKGAREEARVVSTKIDLEDILTEVSGDRLKVHLDDDKRSWWGNGGSRGEIDVYVTYKEIDLLKASSSGSIEAQGTIDADGDFEVGVSSSGDIEASIVADELEIDASSSGDARLKVKVNEIDAEVSSSGDIEVSGVAIRQYVKASSSGDYHGYDVDSEEVDARVSSGGSIKINVKNKLDARASSGGSIRYEGSPEYVDASSSSGGSVKKS